MVFAGYAIMMRMIMIIEHRLQDMDLYVCQIRSVVVPCFAVGGEWDVQVRVRNAG